jgi:GMP synthase (glutamine-hydrolysing)
VLVLQHAEPEHLGRIADALTDEGVEFAYLRPDLGQPIPERLNGFHGLVVMGGPQSVYEEDKFPYLAAEKALTRHAIEMERPILGVCLGSQLLAEVLGSRVYPGGTFELGWKKVTLSPEAGDDRVFGALPSTITPLHWHGDIYELPPGATSVGSSEMTPVQGFVSQGRFYGLLFHLEITPAQLSMMVEGFPDDVRRGGTTPAALLAEAAERAELLREHGQAVFRRWASLV